MLTQQKNQLLGILGSTICPICGDVKIMYTWTCARCYSPHHTTPEHLALCESCDVHLENAEAFLQMVKASQPRIESD